jgi:hypothetical protein
MRDQEIEELRNLGIEELKDGTGRALRSTGGLIVKGVIA